MRIKHEYTSIVVITVKELTPLTLRCDDPQSGQMSANLVELLEITSNDRCPHLPRCERDQQIIDRIQPVGQS